MIRQRFALFSILLISSVTLGCSSAPVASNSVPNLETTKTASDSDAVQEENATEQFVNTMRQWTDDESQYKTNAELVSVSLENRSIKLLKDNGVTIDVSIDRLSQHDRHFLTNAVHAMRDKLVNNN